jgi:hypothetical protein
MIERKVKGLPSRSGVPVKNGSGDILIANFTSRTDLGWSRCGERQ